MLSRKTFPSDALKAAKQLVGSYAHLKPDQPETFLASIASVLAQYPHGLVEECADPRVGIARKCEFLSIAKLVTWLDDRLNHHQTLASYEARSQRTAEYGANLTDEDRKAASEFMAKLTLEIAERNRTVTKSQPREAAE